MPNVHPLLTHFPIALLTIALVFDTLAAVRSSSQLERVGWWLHLSGSLGLVATVISGLFAKGQVFIAETGKTTLETHEQIRFAVSALFAVLPFWRISTKTMLPVRWRPIYLILMFLGVGLVWVGAWYGGELVYTFGVGVRATPF
ncbi:MAG: DUF2231 domain-containing protein [Bacteroidota bacterium]